MSPGWLIGILLMVYYTPFMSGQYTFLYTLNNQGFFHCSNGMIDIADQMGICIHQPIYACTHTHLRSISYDICI